MVEIDYSAAGLPVREDIRDAHRFLWEHLASPGSWWTGAERVAIAAESRAAEHCELCKARREALSPNSVQGRHDTTSALPDVAIDVIHRLRTDPGRLSRTWYEQVLGAGLTEGHYVELVGVVAETSGIDSFARALGIALVALPAPRPGEPSRYRPAAAKPNGAWVPTIAGHEAAGAEAGLYGDGPIVPNIASALSLVPAEVRALRRLSEAHYMGIEHVPDPTFRSGSLDRMQMELVAARVSALNQCFY